METFWSVWLHGAGIMLIVFSICAVLFIGVNSLFWVIGNYDYKKSAKIIGNILLAVIVLAIAIVCPWVIGSG